MKSANYSCLQAEQLAIPLEKRNEKIKDYLCYKTIFCHKVVLDEYLMTFYLFEEKIMLCSRYM